MEKIIDIQLGPRAIKYYIEKRMRSYFDSIDLNISCGPFIMSIRENEGISLKYLSDILIVDKSLTTRNVKTLIEKGFVINTTADTHSYSLKLTDKGVKTSIEVEEQLKMAWSSLLDCLSDEERKNFIDACKKINKKIIDDPDCKVMQE